MPIATVNLDPDSLLRLSVGRSRCLAAAPVGVHWDIFVWVFEDRVAILRLLGGNRAQWETYEMPKIEVPAEESCSISDLIFVDRGGFPPTIGLFGMKHRGFPPTIGLFGMKHRVTRVLSFSSITGRSPEAPDYKLTCSEWFGNTSWDPPHKHRHQDLRVRHPFNGNVRPPRKLDQTILERKCGLDESSFRLTVTPKDDGCLLVQKEVEKEDQEPSVEGVWELRGNSPLIKNLINHPDTFGRDFSLWDIHPLVGDLYVLRGSNGQFLFCRDGQVLGSTFQDHWSWTRLGGALLCTLQTCSVLDPSSKIGCWQPALDEDFPRKVEGKDVGHVLFAMETCFGFRVGYSKSLGAIVLNKLP